MATLVHFDISTDNMDRAKTFYQSLFGWNISPVTGFSDYYEIETEDINGKRSIGGGLTARSNSWQTGITNFIGVKSIDDTIEKLTHMGGKLIQPKQAIPGYGFLAVFTDTENNLVGLFQDDQAAQ